MNKKNLVILGAGFAGIYTYTALPRWIRNTHNITVIDQRNHFLFTPLLAEVAGANLDDHSIVEPIRDILHKEVTFIQAKIISLDSKNKKVNLGHRDIDYDILVSALGSTTHFFGVPGAEEHAFTLKNLEDAVSLRNRCIDLFEQASQIQDSSERKKILSFMIIGAGPTGVELAGELADLFFGTFLEQYKNIGKNDIQLFLINSGGEVLNIFDKKMRDYTALVLERQQVILKNNIRVTEVFEDKVITDTKEEIFAHTIIWTAGVTSAPLSALDILEMEKGRIKVNEYLQAFNTEGIFVLGDMCLVPTDDGRGLPMTAQIAKQQGTQTGRNIGRLLQGKKMKPFVYTEKGLLASIGSFEAVAQIKGFYFTGFLAWFIWRTIYLFNFISWKKRLKIMLEWTINLFARRDTTRS